MTIIPVRLPTSCLKPSNNGCKFKSVLNAIYRHTTKTSVWVWKTSVWFEIEQSINETHRPLYDYFLSEHCIVSIFTRRLQFVKCIQLFWHVCLVIFQHFIHRDCALFRIKLRFHSHSTRLHSNNFYNFSAILKIVPLLKKQEHWTDSPLDRSVFLRHLN